MSVEAFEDFSEASARYGEAEKQRVDTPHVDTVLVSAESMIELRGAYPNYFADGTAFLNAVYEDVPPTGAGGIVVL